MHVACTIHFGSRVLSFFCDDSCLQGAPWGYLMFQFPTSSPFWVVSDCDDSRRFWSVIGCSVLGQTLWSCRCYLLFIIYYFNVCPFQLLLFWLLVFLWSWFQIFNLRFCVWILGQLWISQILPMERIIKTFHAPLPQIYGTSVWPLSAIEGVNWVNHVLNLPRAFWWFWWFEFLEVELLACTTCLSILWPRMHWLVCMIHWCVTFMWLASAWTSCWSMFWFLKLSLKCTDSCW